MAANCCLSSMQINVQAHSQDFCWGGGGGGGGRMSGSGAKCRVGRWVWGYTPQKILKNGLSEAAFRAF